MARIESKDLIPHITSVLERAATGRGDEPHFVTAYQIFRRLPPDIQEDLRREYGPKSGQGSSVAYSAATRIATTAIEIPGVEQRYLDTRGLQFDVGQTDDVNAGFEVCSLFRLPRKLAR